MKEFFTDSEGRIRCTSGGNGSGWKQWSSKDPYKQIGIGKSSSSKRKIVKKHKTTKFSKKKYTDSKIFSVICPCPTCDSKEIFFCNCTNGGKVFFETLYPEWKRHNCSCFQKNILPEKLNLKNNNNYYTILFPTSFNSNKQILSYKNSSCIKNFDIEIRNKYLYKNATENINLLVKCEGSKIILKIILSNQIFLNYILVNDAIFNSFQEFKKFLIYILTQEDLSINKDFKILYNQQVDYKINTKSNIDSSFQGFKKTKWKGIYIKKSS